MVVEGIEAMAHAGTLADVGYGVDAVAFFPAVNPPDPDPAEVPGLGTVATTFIAWLKWVLMIGGVAGLLVCAVMMAVGRRGRSALAAEYAGGIPWVLGGLALGSVAATIVGFVMAL